MAEEKTNSWQSQLNDIYGIADASTEPKPVAEEKPVTQSVAEEALPEYTEIEGENGELACAVCHNPYLPEQLTVASQERFNFESAVVVCPTCLENMRQEVKQRTSGANLAMGSLWGFIVFLVCTVGISLLIWFNRNLMSEEHWEWLGAFVALIPGFAIGKAVLWGAGRKEIIWQRVIAVAFVLLYLLITYSVAILAVLNYTYDIVRPDGHEFLTVPPLDILTVYVPRAFTYFFDQPGTPANPLLGLGLWLGAAAGIASAWFSSAGARLYTRPYVRR